MMRIELLLLLLSVVVVLGLAGGGRGALAGGGEADAVFTVPSVAFGDAEGAGIDAREALATYGLVAVTGVPGLAEAREQALVGAAECVLSDAGAAPVSMTLQDQATTRSSWAAQVQLGKQRETVDATAACPELQAKMERLRDVVDTGSRYFATVLDGSVRVKEFNQGLFSRLGASSSSPYRTFAQVVGEAQHLDHFHVYEKKKDSASPALGMHTDQGLFICIVPSIRVARDGSVNKIESSFVIALPGSSEGEAVHIRLPDSGNVLLFMMGNGINYLKRHSHRPLRAVPHALQFPVSSSSDQARAWFGRMFFAPSDAMLNEEGETFQSVIGSVLDARRLSNSFPSLSCSTGPADPYARVLMDMGGNNCSASEKYCWMGCRSTANLTCDKSVAYCRASNGSVWTEAFSHDMGARLVCPTGSGANALAQAGVALVAVWLGMVVLVVQ